MKNLYKNMVNGSFLGVVLLLGTTACSDDHFDIAGQSGAEGNATTIWQSIESNPDLSDVAEILKAARVMKDEKDSRATLRYSEWLDQPMAVTAWLPKNGTFDKQYYLSKLAEADSLSNDSTQRFAALRLEYQVVNQFVKNHLALFNYGSTSGLQIVRLLNSKNSNFDASKSLFNGTKIDNLGTVHTGNGSLYLLEGISPFAYNIYDYMSSNEDFSKVFDIITDPSVDKNTFSPEGSTQGGINEKGEIVYVDSVFTNSNKLLNSANALIKSEDSIYVAMIPTNSAWNETYDVVKPLFNYGSSYNYEWVSGNFQQSVAFSDKQTDSLQYINTNATIIESMFFNPTSFARENGVPVNKTDSADLFKFMLYDADSLISTNGTIYYNEMANTGLPNPMFADLTPLKASNGYIFAPESNRIKPEYSFLRRYEYRPGAILANLKYCRTEHGETPHLTIDNWNKYDAVTNPEGVKGEVEDDWYHYFEMSGINTMKIQMRLNNLPCGHYKISVQMLPNRINSLHIKYEDDEVTPKKENPQFSAAILSDAIDKNLANKSNIKVNQDSVENIVLFEDFELKKSYWKLPSGYETFPILEISMSSSQSRRGRCTALSISKIVIEPIRK